MARPTKPASEVHPQPVEPSTATAVAEQEPEPIAAAEPPKRTVRFQINQIQKIVFPDKSEYLARVGVHDISDETLIKNLTEYATFPGSKRQIFILNQ